MGLLNKSVFKSGAVCVRRAYFDVRAPELGEPPSESDVARMRMGQEVGRFARRLYDGVLIEQMSTDMAKAAGETERAIAEGATAIYEAAFVSEVGDIRVDVLERLDDGSWHLIEVKSSKEVKPEHIDDVAYQLAVLETCGHRVTKCSLAHVSPEFVMDGSEMVPREFFVVEDVTDPVLAAMPRVLEAIGALGKVIEAEHVPDAPLNVHCVRDACPYLGHCFRSLPENDVTTLPYIKSETVAELESMGIRDIAEVPSSFKLSDRQRLISNVVRTGVPFVSDSLQAVLSEWREPVCFVDFEAVGAAFPAYVGVRPYEPVPFQWSMHVWSDGLTHHEFLHQEDGDPRGRFAESLWDAIQGAGTIVHYASYEKSILKRLAAQGLAFAQDLVDLFEARGVDLEKIVREHVYIPEFRGKTSIKRVYPALVPGAGYGDLQIQGGELAAAEFLRMNSRATTDIERRKIAQSLLAYCERDTQAMVDVYLALVELARTPSGP